MLHSKITHNKRMERGMESGIWLIVQLNSMVVYMGKKMREKRRDE